MDHAPVLAAAKLTFDGVATEGVAVVTAQAALAAELGGGETKNCLCRGACGSNCRCKKDGVLCGRHCGCTTGKGGNCGNHTAGRVGGVPYLIL